MVPKLCWRAELLAGGPNIVQMNKHDYRKRKRARYSAQQFIKFLQEIHILRIPTWRFWQRPSGRRNWRRTNDITAFRCSLVRPQYYVTWHFFGQLKLACVCQIRYSCHRRLADCLVYTQWSDEEMVLVSGACDHHFACFQCTRQSRQKLGAFGCWDFVFSKGHAHA
jgi:hypothetical protein